MTTVLSEVTHEGETKNLWSWNMWSRLFVHLPTGVNRLVLKGIRSSDDQKSGILIDDLTLWPCSKYGELNPNR